MKITQHNSKSTVYYRSSYIIHYYFLHTILNKYSIYTLMNFFQATIEFDTQRNESSLIQVLKDKLH